MNSNGADTPTNQSDSTASSRLEVAITPTTPDSVVTGRLFTIEARVDFNNDFDGDREQVSVTLDFSVNGEQINSKEFQLLEGNAKIRSTKYALTTTGSHTISVSATATIDGSDHTVSKSKSIDSSSATGALDQAHGAGFAVPDSMKDEVNKYRDKYYIDLPYSFVLAREKELYLVFCADEPTPSESVVSGPALKNPKEINIVDEITFKVVAATDTTFITTGESTTVADVESSPSSYAFDLVRIDDHHERVSTLYDPDAGNDITVSSTLGHLKETDSSSALHNPGLKTRELALEVREEAGELRQKLKSFIKQDSPSLTTFNLATNYWSSSNAVVDAIVLPSDSTGREFLSSFDRPGITAESNGEPLLYVIQTGYSTTTYNSVSDLKSGASDGDLVEITADSLLLKVSAQETIEHATSTCGDTKVEIPNVGCVNLVQDVLFEAGVCWTTLPQNTDDILFFVGMSSKHLDQPYEDVNGEYTLRGEVISTSRFDSSLPNGKILNIYELVREGNINYGDIADNIKERIEGQRDILSGAVQHQLQDLANQATESWSFDTDSRLQHSNVAITDSQVFLGGLGQTVYGLDKDTGDSNWTFNRGGSLVDSAPTVSNGKALIGGGDGYIYGLDANTGNQEWTFETGSAVVSSPSLLGSTAYVGNNKGTVYAIDRDTGNEIWSNSFDNAILADPLVNSGTVYVATESGTIAALDASTGTSDWKTDVGEKIGSLSPTLQDGTLYISGDSLHALSASTGSVKWKSDPNGAITTSPVVWNGRVYVGTTTGYVHAFEITSESEEWATNVGSGDRTCVWVDSKLVLATNNGNMTLLDAYFGVPMESVSVGDTIYAPPIVQNDFVYILGGERLTVLNLTSKV